MQIDRSNYEIWLIDWLDGNLNEIEVEQLHHFLGENPDLKAEFDEMAVVRLNPPENHFSDKKNLKKTTANLSESQLEYLAVAYLENDLTPEQESELKESIERDPEKKISFEMIQKMRLSPLEVLYKKKNHLIRRTTGQKVLWLSLIGLSAAAITTFVIINFISVPRILPVSSEKTAQTIIIDTTVRQPVPGKVPEKLITEEKSVPAKKRSRNLLAPFNKPALAISEPGINPDDSLFRAPEDTDTRINKVPVTFVTELKGETLPNTLIALKSPVTIPLYDDGRSKLSKFIAKTFREKILKEKVGKDTPLKAYELAEAGVSGLNKLFGWEMALDKKNDENGELKSVYFSSKILKFNAPVKKSEPLQ